MSKRLSAMLLSIGFVFLGLNFLFFIPNIVGNSRADSPVFGPEKFTRQQGASNIANRTLSLQKPSGTYFLTVQNPEGNRGRSSSANVEINGGRVVDSTEFNSGKDFVTKVIKLEKENSISVEVTSEPGTSVMVSVYDSSSPTESPRPITNADATRQSLSPSVQAAAQFDQCVEDETAGNRLQFNSANGEYRFIRVNDSFTLTGTGTTIIRGSTVTLQHFATDRRVTASIDNSVRRGTASVQIFSLQTTYTITDKNTTNNNCGASIGTIRMTPDALFISEPATVNVVVRIPYDPSQGLPVVNLQRVSASGVVIGTEGQLTDDGNLNNGDEIAGDGAFSIRKLFSSQVESRIRLRIALHQGSLNIFSNAFFLDVYSHLTSAQLNTILSSESAAAQTYNNLLPSLGRAGARDAALSQLRQNPSVAEADISESGNGIWMRYSSGILGSISLNPPGTRGGIRKFSSPAPKARIASGPKPPVAFSPAADHISIKSKKAIVLSPFLADFGSTDEGPEVVEMFRNSACPPYSVTNLSDSDVTVDVMKTLNQYGIVVIASHGDGFYQRPSPPMQDMFLLPPNKSQVLVLTGQKVNDSNRAANEIDLKKGRLVISAISATDSVYSIMPSFINDYGKGGYPDSLIYIGSCESTFTDAMATAFFNNGAKTYLGYSQIVDSGFAGNVGRVFFHRFLEDPTITNTGQAFISGQQDGNNPPAVFQLLGSMDLAKPDVGLENGGFEAGTLGAWAASGDGRIVTQLGEFNPTEGFHAGLISTGLGFTVTSGSIEQKVCLPSNAQRLEFNWNFNSEEFVEYCTSIFQDFFRVDIVTDTGTNSLFFRRVDDLCSTVAVSGLHFDQSSGSCQPSPRSGFGTGGNDCLVWTTGWRSESVDIAAIAAANAGKSVTIRFSAGDVGDSIFDSAILLDNIKIVTP
jgi:hypothetical protein